MLGLGSRWLGFEELHSFGTDLAVGWGLDRLEMGLVGRQKDPGLVDHIGRQKDPDFVDHIGRQRGPDLVDRIGRQKDPAPVGHSPAGRPAGYPVAVVRRIETFCS